MPQIELRQIEAFLAVAEERHFGRAGERLLLGTSQVSQLVSALERRIGGKLFSRTSRRVDLTPLGLALQSRVRPAYEGLAHAIETTRADAQRARGVLRVGVPTSFAPDLVTPLVEGFAASTGIAVEHRPYPFWDVARSAQIERWDAFIILSIDGLRWDPTLSLGPVLRTVDRRLLLSRRHPLGRRAVADHMRAAVDIEELADHHVIRPAQTVAVVSQPGVAEMLSAWYPETTPGGRPIAYAPVLQAALWDELPDALGAGDAVHLTFDVLSERLLPEPLMSLPLLGLPPAAMRMVWPEGPHAATAEAFAAWAVRPS